MNKKIRLISLIAAFLLLSGSLMTEAIGGYFSTRPLSFSVSPDLSAGPRKRGERTLPF